MPIATVSATAMQRAITSPIDPETVTGGPAQEVVVTRRASSSATCCRCCSHAPGDSGRFVTAGVVLVRDPETGVPNASYHRLQLLGGNRTAIKLDYGRHLRAAHERAIAGGRRPPHRRLPSGRDLSLLYAAAFMGSQMPEDADELAAAGGIQGRAAGDGAGDHQRPARAGPQRDRARGPHLADRDGAGGAVRRVRRATRVSTAPAPVVTVDAVTHRRDPIYYAINGAGPRDGDAAQVRARGVGPDGAARRRADRHRRQPHGRRAAPFPRRRPGGQTHARGTTVSSATPCSPRSPR